jgi:Putative NAD(P)-binding
VPAALGEPHHGHRRRAQDAHRRLLEHAAERGSKWQAEGAPLRVERVIVGGGLAATLDWATQTRTDGSCVVLARAEEPWWSRREHRLGQPASELVSEGFVIQPHELAKDVDGFAPASALADAIALTAHEHGMPLVLGCRVDRPIERTEDGRFVLYAGGRTIEAEQVDVAVGPGPAMRLGTAIVTQEDERELLADGRMVFGQDQWQQPVRSGRVLVIGGGATSAWNVELALRHGAEVTWVAPASESKHLGRLRLKAQELAKHLEDRPELDAERRRWLERTRARIIAFGGADLPRNREVFRASEVEWWVGTVARLRPAINGVEALIRRDGRDELAALRFEQVVVAIGQDSYAPEASASLVLRLSMTWLERDHGGPRPADPGSRPVGRIVGACEVGPSPRLRCLGVLLRSSAWRNKLWRQPRRRRSNAAPALELRLDQQVNAAPRHSRGIDGTVFQVSADVVLANERPLDPSLGHERHELLTATLGTRAPQPAVATSSGEGG